MKHPGKDMAKLEAAKEKEKEEVCTTSAGPSGAHEKKKTKASRSSNNDLFGPMTDDSDDPDSERATPDADDDQLVIDENRAASDRLQQSSSDAASIVGEISDERCGSLFDPDVALPASFGMQRQGPENRPETDASMETQPERDEPALSEVQSEPQRVAPAHVEVQPEPPTPTDVDAQAVTPTVVGARPEPGTSPAHTDSQPEPGRPTHVEDQPTLMNVEARVESRIVLECETESDLIDAFEAKYNPSAEVESRQPSSRSKTPSPAISLSRAIDPEGTSESGSASAAVKVEPGSSAIDSSRNLSPNTVILSASVSVAAGGIAQSVASATSGESAFANQPSAVEREAAASGISDVGLNQSSNADKVPVSVSSSVGLQNVTSTPLPKSPTPDAAPSSTGGKTPQIRVKKLDEMLSDTLSAEQRDMWIDLSPVLNHLQYLIRKEDNNKINDYLLKHGREITDKLERLGKKFHQLVKVNEEEKLPGLPIDEYEKLNMFIWAWSLRGPRLQEPSPRSFVAAASVDSPSNRISSQPSHSQLDELEPLESPLPGAVRRRVPEALSSGSLLEAVVPVRAPVPRSSPLASNEHPLATSGASPHQSQVLHRRPSQEQPRTSQHQPETLQQQSGQREGPAYESYSNLRSILEVRLPPGLPNIGVFAPNISRQQPLQSQAGQQQPSSATGQQHSPDPAADIQQRTQLWANQTISNGQQHGSWPASAGNNQTAPRQGFSWHQPVGNAPPAQASSSSHLPTYKSQSSERHQQQQQHPQHQQQQHLQQQQEQQLQQPHWLQQVQQQLPPELHQQLQQQLQQLRYPQSGQQQQQWLQQQQVQQSQFLQQQQQMQQSQQLISQQLQQSRQLQQSQQLQQPQQSQQLQQPQQPQQPQPWQQSQRGQQQQQQQQKKKQQPKQRSKKQEQQQKQQQQPQQQNSLQSERQQLQWQQQQNPCQSSSQVTVQRLPPPSYYSQTATRESSVNRNVGPGSMHPRPITGTSAQGASMIPSGRTQVDSNQSLSVGAPVNAHSGLATSVSQPLSYIQQTNQALASAYYQSSYLTATQSSQLQVSHTAVAPNQQAQTPSMQSYHAVASGGSPYVYPTSNTQSPFRNYIATRSPAYTGGSVALANQQAGLYRPSVTAMVTQPTQFSAPITSAHQPAVPYHGLAANLSSTASLGSALSAQTALPQVTASQIGSHFGQTENLTPQTPVQGSQPTIGRPIATNKRKSSSEAAPAISQKRSRAEQRPGDRALRGSTGSESGPELEIVSAFVLFYVCD